MSRVTYRLIDGELLEVSKEPPAPSIMVMRDTPEYHSPITGRLVDGRAARREDLKRSGCREVDPSERTRAITTGRMDT